MQTRGDLLQSVATTFLRRLQNDGINRQERMKQQLHVWQLLNTKSTVLCHYTKVNRAIHELHEKQFV